MKTIIALLALLIALPVWAFDVDLIMPSARPPLAPMVYARVSGDIDFGMNQPLLESDFLQFSMPKAESDTPGHFTIYIDGFKLTIGTDTASGTFGRD